MMKDALYKEKKIINIKKNIREKSVYIIRHEKKNQENW